MLLDGSDIATFDPKWLHQQIGLITAEPLLVSTTIADNISSAPPSPPPTPPSAFPLPHATFPHIFSHVPSTQIYPRETGLLYAHTHC